MKLTPGLNFTTSIMKNENCICNQHLVLGSIQITRDSFLFYFRGGGPPMRHLVMKFCEFPPWYRKPILPGFLPLCSHSSIFAIWLFLSLVGIYFIYNNYQSEEQEQENKSKQSIKEDNRFDIQLGMGLTFSMLFKYIKYIKVISLILEPAIKC